jgi:hypothetical protein
VLTVYTHVCVPCKYKSQMRTVNRIARERGQSVRIIETKGRADLLAEAKSLSDCAMPFVYNDRTSESFPLNKFNKDMVI